MRIGHGYDVHRLVEDRLLILGGVTIPYEKGLEGHSDADAVIHALCDAILGALCLGDIGNHFPDTDPELKNVDSRILLKHIATLMQEKNYELGNADITILAQAPKMAGHIASMRENLAADLNTSVDNLNIKATTTEKMGFVGLGEGIAAHAVVLLNSI
ncbi:MAG TPA: 2-C-methyl-D-erythritol 2,4-cyclodiphosphate synthase [Thiotrichaceae bacterium]|jgi:2-C-methyl-D-erythritol 2,4-cyclodiphosphate synthase|nr:2-C-methyl-D-erythritol 2,4-cyclodiphosphate synthase [Thiotrichaceae bacterium]HIM08263.1 2-C-methyl-D-erythritol 2,4-cyclodiphosphate synthase [Gammaproteobacteria bacterium]